MQAIKKNINVQIENALYDLRVSPIPKNSPNIFFIPANRWKIKPIDISKSVIFKIIRFFSSLTK